MVDTETINVGGNLTFYAAGYDAKGNFNNNAFVDWHTSGNLSGLGDSVNTYYVD